MKIIAFDVRSTIAHFRRPDTTSTHLTFPFIPPTAAKGLVGAVLGIEDFVTTDQVGIQLLSEVRMISQRLSLLGKGGGNTFNRPTTIQLLVEPAYRVYYAGEQYTDRLEFMLQNKQAIYSTYLGSAFSLTTPEYAGTWDVSEVDFSGDWYSAISVVPASIIEELSLEDGNYYQRASGFMKKYEGGRSFTKSVDFIYEQRGAKLTFKLKGTDVEFTSVELDGELVCLL
ncbi:MAG: CRISPR-associated protein Cas5 [Firmicutes bacterium]|nr:CRISPR-associated protein Cas5 [Bacillota bacterium]